MPYQDPGIQKLDWSAHMEPDSFYWPGYMWLWLDQLDKATLLDQLEAFYRMGARSVWILPLAKIWRAYLQPTELEPDYLSEPFNELLQATIAAAKRLGMRLWLNDEPGFPSGGNVGSIVKAHPELIQKKLIRRQVKLKRGERSVVPDCIAAFAGQREDDCCPLQPGACITAEADWTLTLYQAEAIVSDRVPNYTDLLNPATARQFIAQCHEALKAVAGAHFGETIPILFFDEPKVQNPPWTDDLATSFAAEKGYDIRSRLHHLFDQAESGSQVRIDFFDWWTRQLAERFFAPVQDWCRQNNLLLAGHFGGDDYTLGNSRHGYGHILRVLRKADIPCVDTIWRQIWPGMRDVCDDGEKAPNHHFPKYAASVAHQAGRPWAGTESFAVYGSGLTHEQMKWITDYQYVRGINLMTMSNALSSTRDYFMGRIRPTFVPVQASPLNPYLDLYHTYTARLSYWLSRGTPAVAAALYLPLRDVWAGGETAALAAAAHDRLAQQLLEQQCDFDLIDDDVLNDTSHVTPTGQLQVGPMRYDTVYLAPTRWISQGSLAKLARFAAAGGKVIWVGDTAACLNTAGLTVIPENQLDAYTRSLIEVRPAQPQLRVCSRILANGRLYFLCNEATEPISCTVTIPDHRPLYVCDLASGTAWQPTTARKKDNNWQLPLDLPFAGSCLVYLTDACLPTTDEPMRAGAVVRTLTDGWQLKAVRRYQLGAHDFEIDPCRTPFVPTRPGDWTDQLGQTFCGDALYRVCFTSTKEEADRCALLDLGQVHVACTVLLNGRPVGRRSWGPYLFAVAGRLQVGQNELLVTVSNTMANQFVGTSVLDRWPHNVIGPYHEKAKKFEQETVAAGSGLFGPVRLLACAAADSRQPEWCSHKAEAPDKNQSETPARPMESVDTDPSDPGR